MALRNVEDLKETAACGMVIHYTVNSDDMIAYNDINGRGVECAGCKGCSWRALCKPTPEQVATITIDELIELLKQSSAERGAVTGDFNGAYGILKDHYYRYKESGGVSMEEFAFIRGMLYGLYATDFVTAEQLDTMISDLIAMK